jgi:hypothetical protein
MRAPRGSLLLPGDLDAESGEADRCIQLASVSPSAIHIMSSNKGAYNGQPPKFVPTPQLLGG